MPSINGPLMISSGALPASRTASRSSSRPSFEPSMMYRGSLSSGVPARAGTPLERLPRYIIEGSKEGLLDDLEAVREAGRAPLEIINGPLMEGMREVGRLFNDNELIVAEVLQSAEAMKAAVGHL